MNGRGGSWEPPRLHWSSRALLARDQDQLSDGLKSTDLVSVGGASTIGAISQYAVVDMGFLYVEHSWIQAVSFLIQRGLVYMHKPHNTCYITHSMHTQWLVCTRQLTHNHSLLPKAKQCHPDNTCDCFLLLDGFLDCVLTSDILPHDSVLARGGRVDKHISWSQRWCGGPQSL